MFLAGKPVIMVAISLGFGYEEVKQYYHEYLFLNDLDDFVKITKDHRYYLPFLFQVAEKMKSHDFDEADVNNLIENMNNIKPLEDVRNDLQHQVNILTVKRDDLLHSTDQNETTEL